MKAAKPFLIFFLLVNSLNLFAVLIDASDFRDRTLRIRGDQNYPPYEFINENGEPDGFNIELIEAIAKELELNYTIELGPWNVVLEELENGEIDLLMGALVSEYRSQKLIFGLPHNLVTHGIFTHRSKNFKSLESLRGKQIVVQDRDIMHEYLLESALTDQIILAGSQMEALQLLENGHFDAALMSNFMGYHLIKKYKLKNVALRTSGIKAYKYAMAAHKDNEEIIHLMNQGLHHLKTDGTYDALHKKWFSVYEDFYYFHKYKILIFSLAGAFLLLAVFFYLLKIQVKRAVSKLHQSETQFKRLIEAAPIGIVISDQNQNVVLTNEKFVEMFGYSAADHSNVDDWWLLAYPDEAYRQSVKEYWRKATEAALKNKAGFPAKEFSITCKDGTICHAEVGLASLGHLNMVTFSDVTHRKTIETALRDSEEKFSKAFNSSPDVIIISDVETGKILDVNDNIFRAGGFTKAETIGRTSIELGLWQDIEDRKKYIEILTKNGRVVSFETTFIKKDGSKLFGLISGEIIQIKNRNFLLSVVKDITHLKEIENELKVSEKSLRKLNANKDLFFSIIAHDLRSPFNAIIGFSDVLMEEAGNANKAEVHYYSSIIHNTANQTLSLLDNLLLWARLQQGRIEFKPSNLNFAELLNLTLESVSGNAIQKQISIETNLDNGFSLYADENMLMVIVRNLLNNAIKFTPKGGSVKVSAFRNNTNFNISIADTGVGMTREQIAELFAEDINKSTLGTGKEKGAGLGLLLCKEFVDFHKGSITVESHKDRGTTFTISLPYQNSYVKQEAV